MRILDIGGGFCAGALDPTTGAVDMGGVPAAVNATLDAHFPVSSGVRVIAEPGRYFAEAPSTLACMVYGVRDGVPSAGGGVPSAGGGPATRDYWITDGERLPLLHVLWFHIMCLWLHVTLPVLIGTYTEAPLECLHAFWLQACTAA
jgi:hypothetical protein